MIAYAGLAAQYPGRVHALLGNHEHGHIGGPHTAKFAADEVALLEQILGPAGDRAHARHHPHVRARRGQQVRRGVHARRAGRADRVGRRPRGRGPLGRRLREPARRPRHAGRRQDPVGALGDRGRGPPVPARDAAARSASTATTSSPRASRPSATSRSSCRPASACSTRTRSTSPRSGRASTGASTTSAIGHEILPLYPDKAPARLGGSARSSGTDFTRLPDPAARGACFRRHLPIHTGSPSLRSRQ